MTTEDQHLTWRIGTILVVPIVGVLCLFGITDLSWLAGTMVAAIVTSKYIDYLERNDEHSTNR